MAGRFWNTLAVDDVERARAFYSALGFEVRDAPGGPSCITVHVDDALICLFPRAMFAGMVPGGICDTSKTHEVIQSYGAGSRAEVDALVERAVAAGGRAVGEPVEQAWGYGRGFCDPDGHLWSLLFMPGVA